MDCLVGCCFLSELSAFIYIPQLIPIQFASTDCCKPRGIQNPDSDDEWECCPCYHSVFAMFCCCIVPCSFCPKPVRKTVCCGLDVKYRIAGLGRDCYCVCCDKEWFVSREED